MLSFFKDDKVPLFPITYGMDGLTMTLHADGRVEGDAEAWGKLFATGTRTRIGNVDLFTPVLFLLWREMVRQREAADK